MRVRSFLRAIAVELARGGEGMAQQLAHLANPFTDDYDYDYDDHDH